MALFTFFAFAAVAIISALFVVLHRRAVYSALALIVCFGSMALLYFQLGAHFVGAIQVIVYAGAIMVLFLFVVMLMDPASELFPPNRLRRVGVWGGVFTVISGYVLVRSMMMHKLVQGESSFVTPVENARQLAQQLFRDYLLPFEVTSVLILVAVIGAVVLTKRPN